MRFLDLNRQAYRKGEDVRYRETWVPIKFLVAKRWKMNIIERGYLKKDNLNYSYVKSQIHNIWILIFNLFIFRRTIS